MPRRFLVGHDGSPASSRAVAETAWLARARHGVLTVVLAPPRVPRWTAFSPVSVVMLDYDARLEAERELARTVKDLPTRVSVTTLETSRPLGCALLDLWRRGCHDQVVLAAGGPFTVRRGAARTLRRAGVELSIVGERPRRRRARRPFWRRRRARARAARAT